MKKKTKDILLDKIHKKTEIEIGGIDRKIEMLIESSILSLIGIEKNGHQGHSIDHCNGRNSVLIDAFRNLAVKKAEKMARELKLDSGNMGIYKSAFEREYSSHINREIKNLAAQRAKDDAKAFLSDLETNVEDFLDLEKI